MKTRSLLRPLADAGDERVCGGKAAGLARLIRCGVATPAGSVIEAGVFAAQLEHAGLSADAAALDDELPNMAPETLLVRSGALRESMLHEALPAPLQAALQRVFDHRSPGALLAVRSSAIGEDHQEASFAGQYDSVLGVASYDALEDAVRQVWASAFGVRALRYGQHRGLRPAAMAVIVQEQVDAQVSGVLFTRDPAHPEHEQMVMEYCAGLGDRLVSGDLNPARAWIARHDLSVQTEPRADGDPVFEPPAHAAVLTLAKHALQLERSIGKPLDIEWSIDREGRLMFLQCRPMTAVAPTATSTATQQLWSNANISENFPGPVVPFLSSFVARGYADYFRGLGLAFGISRRRLDAMAPAMDGLVGLQAGRLYYNLSHIHTVLHLAPGGPWLARFFNQFTGAEGTPAPQQLRSHRAARFAEGLRIVCKVPWQYLRMQQRVMRFEHRVDAFAAQAHPRRLTELPMPALAAQLRVFLDIRLHRWTDAALADTAAMVCYGVLKLLLDRWLPHPHRSQLQNDLLQGMPGLASSAPVEALWALAQRARADAAPQAVLRHEPAERVLAALDAPACAAFRFALADYLERWGFRYSGELMLTQATPAESPVPVIRLLQIYLGEEGPGPGQITAERALAREAVTSATAALLTPSAVQRSLPLPTRARVFRTVLAATQGAIRLRERARMKQALLYTRLRHVALALGERLVAQQVLRARDDVFYLTIDETIALGESSAPALHPALAKIGARRAEFEAFKALRPPDQFTLAVGERWMPDREPATEFEPENGMTLKGIGACGGCVIGPAAVVLDVTQADALSAGAVLVTRQTDPGWAPVFFLVQGLIVERGGMLSHGAIIAREYGIPAVVGVRGATSWVQPGDTLRVDGDAGVVERIRG